MRARITVRGVPPEVDRILRERAKLQKTSLNQVIVDELTKATVGPRQFADFSNLVGRWIPDPEFDKSLEDQRQVEEW